MNEFRRVVSTSSERRRSTQQTGKEDHSMTTIDEVQKTGMAIEQARKIIDKAMPQGQDLLPEYDYAMRAPLYNLAHSGIENGIKALIRQVKGCHPGGHNLKNLFRKLKGIASQKARSLEDAFTDIVNFYTIDTGRWMHFQSLDSYFKEYGSEELFEAYRYWALENKCMHHIPLFVHRELLAWLGDYCQWGNRTVTSQRVKQIVLHDVAKGVGKHINRCDICYGKTPGPPIPIPQRSHLSCIQLFRRLIDIWCCYFKVSNDECVKEITYAAVQCLQKSKDPAVRYFANTLQDLPEGSMPKPGDVKLQVDVSGMVRIRNGEALGRLSNTIDGRWSAYTYEYGQPPKFAKTRDDAMYWLVHTCTEMVQISVNGGQNIQKRAICPVDLMPTSSGDGLSSSYKITFADDSHGLSVGQHIKVRDGSPIPFTASGVIFKVSGAMVEFGDEVPQ